MWQVNFFPWRKHFYQRQIVIVISRCLFTFLILWILILSAHYLLVHHEKKLHHAIKQHQITQHVRNIQHDDAQYSNRLHDLRLLFNADLSHSMPACLVQLDYHDQKLLLHGDAYAYAGIDRVMQLFRQQHLVFSLHQIESHEGKFRFQLRT